MSLLRSSCLLARFTGSVHSQSLRIPYTQTRCVTMKISKAQSQVEESFEERNAAAGRPLSPHLTIYSLQLTSMMSISYRVSGMAMAGYAVFLASASFVTPDMAHTAQTISDIGLPIFLTFPLKFLLALPATYHLCNGIRHLTWDTGRFLTLKGVYTGGYITIAATLLSAFYLAM